MAFRVTRSAQFYDKEVLKYGHGLDHTVIKSVVLDANGITQSTDPALQGRTVVPAGTILTKSADGLKMVPWIGATTQGSIEGILARPVEVLAKTTAGLEPAPMFYRAVVFATVSIVGYTLAGTPAALSTALPTCGFE